MVVRILGRALLTTCVLTCCARASAAQTIGTFRWQALPFCNVITLTVVQVGSIFTLDGFDDQCGAATRASVVGTAFFNPDGSVGIGLTTIATPGGGPVHVDVALSLATLNGPWRDSAGNEGTFAFTTSTGTGGSPRPLGRGIGIAAIDPRQVQRRVTGTCAAGSVVRFIHEDGSVGCDAAGAGDITGVTAGAGLTGGAPSGAATLGVAFGGPGAADFAARSDHRHEMGIGNTAVGSGALQAITTGQFNLGAGMQSLRVNTTGDFNTAIGPRALWNNVSGSQNTAVGGQAGLTVAGSKNTLVGFNANPGSANLQNASAIGADAQVNVSNAIVLGSIAGLNGGASNVNVGIGTTSPTHSLHVVGNDGGGRIQIGDTSEVGNASETRIISFGDASLGGFPLVYVGEEDANDRLVLRGTNGVRFKTGLLDLSVGPDADDLLVLGGPSNRWTAVWAVDGTINTSDARLKRDIADLDYGLSSILKLRPVSFRWKDREDGSTNLGLLAQEVEPVIPEAVVRGAAPDEPLGMNYSTLIPVLIKAIQEQQARIVALERQLQLQTAAR
jgi:hypothetical protein